jgi:GT2 family glycosyltransferase
MASETKVGVIVLNWNGLQDTRACLHSLLALDGPPPVTYVVDNGSTDGSVRALHDEFGERIVLISNPRNLLYAGGNNVGILRALGDTCSHLLLLNNDTIVDGGLVTELSRAAAEHGDAILCPKIYYSAAPQRLWYAGGKMSLRRARFSHRGIREEDTGQYDQTEETDWATGCALFGSRKVFETVGLLDESFRLYCEDVDYCLRAKKAGFRIIYVPQAKVWHKVSASVGGNLSRAKLNRKWSSLRRLIHKHLPNPLMRCLALSDFMVTESVRVLSASVRGKLRQPKNVRRTGV